MKSVSGQRGFLLNPFRFGGGGGGGGSDLNRSSLVLLNNHQGANNSTTFTDASPVGRTLTANAGAKISTAEFIFGSSSAVFDGVGDYVGVSSAIAIADSAVWSLGMWFRPDEATSTNPSFDHMQLLVNSGGNADVIAAFYYSAALAGRSLFGAPDSSTLLQEGVTDLSANTWYYLLLKNDPTGNVFEWWIGASGGSLVSQGTTTKRGLQMGHYGAFGNPPPNNEFKGYIGPMRVYSGYSEATAMPTALFPET